jgi:hypothetical protein
MGCWWFLQPEETEQGEKQAMDITMGWSEEEQHRQVQFVAACRELREKVQRIEASQINILVTLLTTNDTTHEVYNGLWTSMGQCIILCVNSSCLYAKKNCLQNNETSSRDGELGKSRFIPEGFLLWQNDFSWDWTP